MLTSIALAAAMLTHVQKPTFVFVHGAFEDSSIWKMTSERLHADGYRTISVNLPGRKGNPADPRALTLDTYRDAVLKSIQGETRQVVLVGHSFGGITISDVAEAAPDKVKTLVFLAALLPRDGDSLAELLKENKESGMVEGDFQIAADGTTATIAKEHRVFLFAHDASPDVQKPFPDWMVPEPTRPLGEQVHLTDNRFGKTDKVYIFTSQDHILAYPFQRRMEARTPVRATWSLPTSHTPFLSHPGELVHALESLAG